MIAGILILLGVFSRLLPHMPNFSPVVGIALFSGVYLKKGQALTVPFFLYVLSDILLGMHDAVLFTWSSILLISYLGMRLKQTKTASRVISYAVLSSVLFFLITNFGVWLLWYPRSFEGFVECFTLAVPFFRISVLADLLYVGVLFGTYELSVRWIKSSRARRILFAE